MYYNLRDGFELEKFREKIVELQNRRAMVSLVEKKAKSLQQMKYLHLMLSSFALQYGYTLEEVKVHFYKLVVNKDIFVREGTDKFTGEIYTYCRSTSTLDQDEMSESITRFHSWAKDEAGFDFPSSNEYIALLHIEHDIENNKQYL